jgi:hypothetical protein
MINIHSGLSPYYRGTWSYGWPLVNREPEYIGVTVHHVNAGIDTGDIIYQTRPCLEKDDDLNSIFLKVIAEGIELMVKAISEISNKGDVKSHQQPRNIGRLYQMKDFNAGAARTCLKNLEDGIISEYLSQREGRDSNYPVLLFHSTEDRDLLSLKDLGNIRPELFEKLIVRLRKEFDIIRLDELVRCISGSAKPKDRLLAITFDDGPKSYITQALPVMEVYDVPSTCFLITDCVDDKPCTGGSL